MGKWIRRTVMAVLLAVFLFSAGSILVIMNQYRISDQLYDDIASQYTHEREAGEKQETGGREEQTGENGPAAERAPITVDLEGLLAANDEVVGWIYCEDTPINYPVVRGEDNDYYLRHSYDGKGSAAGSIFVEAANQAGFADSNTIIYGHHMKNGSMFAGLDKWADQEYYEEHPVMWLLTPEQDFKVLLFSGYTTSAASDTYTIFTGPAEEIDDYLRKSVSQSDFQANVVLYREARYVLLSTCAYVFDNARYVLHGVLVPVDSAGGAPLPEGKTKAPR